MNQKRCVLIFISFFIMTFLVGTISAAPDNPQSGNDNVRNAVNTVIAVFQPISEAVLGVDAQHPAGDYFFARVVFALLIVLIVYLAIYKIDFFKHYTVVSWIVAIAIGVLSMRYIVDDNWIQAILLPYATLGVAISAGLPFVIYFLVVDMGGKNTVPIFRKTAWIFFAVIFFGLWVTRKENIADQAIWIYPITGGLAIIMALLDGTINRFFTRAAIQRARLNYMEDSSVALYSKLAKLQEAYNAGMPEDEYDRQFARINKAIENMGLKKSRGGK